MHARSRIGKNKVTFTEDGRGPYTRVVVSTARVRVSVPGLCALKETKMFLPHPCWATVCDVDPTLNQPWLNISSLQECYRSGAVFSYKLRYIVGFWLVEMAISTNQKPTIYRNLYENTGTGRDSVVTINPQPFKPSRCIKASFYIPENRLYSPTTKGFRTKISMKLAYQYMAIFFNFSTTSNHLHPLQVENCDSNLRLVEDEDDNGKFRPERVKVLNMSI